MTQRVGPSAPFAAGEASSRLARGGRRGLLSFVVTLALLTLFHSTAEAQALPSREWTVMVFMNGKNNLEPDALNNFHAMASVGSTDKIALVAQLGRPKVHHTTADGDWSGVYRFLVGKGQLPRPEQAVEKVAAGTASDMGKPATLSAFIGWSKAKYPAKRYMLIIWNHGQGYRLLLPALTAAAEANSKSKLMGTTAAPRPGFGTVGGFRAVSSDDDTGSILYNSEVQRSIAAHFSPSNKLDLLGFDACLMSMIETAYAVAPTAKAMVASEELEPGDGWQYADWLASLAAKPEMTSTDLGKAIVDSYAAHYGDSYFTTLSLLDLSKVRDVAAGLSSFADMVRKGGVAELAAMRSARQELSSYADWDEPPSHLSIDLSTLLFHYHMKTKNAVLRQTSEALAAGLQEVVLANYASARSQGSPGQGVYGSKGLAIYYPASAADFRADYFHKGYLKTNTDRPIEFVRQERWAELLYALLGI